MYLLPIAFFFFFQEACLNPIYLQALLDYMQTDGKQTGSHQCCSAFPGPLLRLLSIGSLASQRVVGCLLAKSAWLFKIISTPKLLSPRPPFGGMNPRLGINGTLLESILQTWMEVRYWRLLCLSVLNYLPASVVVR